MKGPAGARRQKGRDTRTATLVRKAKSGVGTNKKTPMARDST